MESNTKYAIEHQEYVFEFVAQTYILIYIILCKCCVLVVSQKAHIDTQYMVRPTSSTKLHWTDGQNSILCWVFPVPTG